MFFEVDAWGEAVGDGATRSHYCTLGAVAKVSGPESELAAPNEFICGRLALLIGLPVPPGVLVTTDAGGAAYVALRFGRKGERPPPVIPADLVADEPSLSAGIVAFDYWVANQDRHAGNLAYEREGVPPAAFDHERALLGLSRAGALQRLTDIDDQRSTFGGCLGALLRDGTHLVDWAHRIERLPAEAITATCAEAARDGHLGEELGSAAARFLVGRRSLVIDMLRTTLPGVTSWGVLP